MHVEVGGQPGPSSTNQVQTASRPWQPHTRVVGQLKHGSPSIYLFNWQLWQGRRRSIGTLCACFVDCVLIAALRRASTSLPQGFRVQIDPTCTCHMRRSRHCICVFDEEHQAHLTFGNHYRSEAIYPTIDFTSSVTACATSQITLHNHAEVTQRSRGRSALMGLRSRLHMDGWTVSPRIPYHLHM